jgi:hypothetical protein
MNRLHQTRVGAVLVLLTCSAFADQQPAGPGPDEEVGSANVSEQTQPKFWTRDDEFARVARAEVPGFAGYYLDDDGTPVILLKDHRQRDAAEQYLAAELEDALRGIEGGYRAPIFRKVTHDFADLKGWFDNLRGLLSREDVYMLDVDEVGNRVFVGVRDEAAIRAVRREAARLRVPPGKLNVEIRPAPEQLIGLQDRTSYLTGGYKIEAFTGGGCTLGFNATYLGISVFVTNSHCTYNYLAYDGGTFTQPTYFAGNEVGQELTDKALYNCNNSSLICRRSDSAYVQHNGSRTIGQGKIAYTEQATGGPAPNLTVLGYYDIIRRYSGTAPVGLTLTKTGQKTGTTFGNITQSCVTISGNNGGREGNKYYRLECQDVSNVYAEYGDSGSPMYRRVTSTQVELYGILWGRSEAGTTSSSPLSGIEADLGELINLCAPGNGC